MRDKDNTGPAEGNGRSHGDLFVVGIGASAGGIAALRELFGAMPDDIGMAFVVILHLSEEHESSLSEILQRETSLKVEQVTGRTKVKPNRVYVIPPAKGLTLIDGSIDLTEPERVKGKRVPIDLFFRALAEVYGSNGIAVVLSGTGSDGTIGIKRVKEHGGIGIAQLPADAEYDSMPRSAINTSLVDLILPVREIPRKLVELREHGKNVQLLPTTDDGPAAAGGTSVLHELLGIVQKQTGHDFKNYKTATILRRVARRLQVTGLLELPDYLEYIRQNPDEAEMLQRDLLITVTNFFRDDDAWAVFAKDIVPQLFAGKTLADAVRVWSVGCATGEEAYSLAIVLDEYASTLPSPPVIQIFASDINEDAIATARQCFYEETIVADVSPERLRRYFTKEGSGYLLRKEIRSTVLFAPHNVLRDPPFSMIDLIVCRNLLIYLNRDTQEKVFEIFNFSLRPDGYLFLGGSESADYSPQQFEIADKKYRIYKCRKTQKTRSVPLLLSGKWSIRGTSSTPSRPRPKAVGIGDLHYKLVEAFAPPSVLIDSNYDVLHVSEHAGRFLNVGGGTLSHNLIELVDPALRLDLQGALFEVTKKNSVSESRNVRFPVKSDGRPDEDETLVNMTVRSVTAPETADVYYLVVFDESKTLATPYESGRQSETVGDRNAADNAVSRMEEELRLTRERLRTTIEQGEISQEELKSANEELQALNEELRSAGEELETSKEELQSLNEELMTVNTELREKIDETLRINSDLQNLIQSTDIGTIFLDRQLRLRRYTPRVTDVFNIIPSDIGRPLEHLTHKLDHDGIVEDAREVLATLRVRDLEVRGGEDDSRYLLRVAPYRTAEDKVDGAVLLFQDITELKRSGDLLLESEEQYKAIVNQNLAGIGKLDLAGNISFTNDKLCEMLGHACGGLVGVGMVDLIYPDNRPEFVAAFKKLLADGPAFEIEERFVRTDGSLVWIHLGASPLEDTRGNLHEIAIVLIDITERKRAEDAFRKSEERLRLVSESFTDYAIFTADINGIVLTWNTGAQKIFGYEESEIVGTLGHRLFTPEDNERGIPELEMKTARETGRAADERWHIRKDGSRFFASGVMAPLFDDDVLIGYAKIARDLTLQKRTEEELQEHRERLEMLVSGRTAELAQANETLRLQMEQRRLIEEERFALLQKIVTTQEDERRRIARDMHDSLGQQLTALRLKIASMKNELHEGLIEENLERLQDLGKRIDSEVNFLVWELRPTVLDDLGLVAALDNYVREWSKHVGIPAEFQARRVGSERLDSNIETNLYRIAQEALNNTHKHSKAKTASVLLEPRRNEIVLVIEDDGIGFDMYSVKGVTESGRGLGLIGMRERAAIIDGSIEIESSPGKGTTVYVRVPIKREK